MEPASAYEILEDFVNNFVAKHGSRLQKSKVGCTCCDSPQAFRSAFCIAWLVCLGPQGWRDCREGRDWQWGLAKTDIATHCELYDRLKLPALCVGVWDVPCCVVLQSQLPNGSFDNFSLFELFERLPLQKNYHNGWNAYQEVVRVDNNHNPSLPLQVSTCEQVVLWNCMTSSPAPPRNGLISRALANEITCNGMCALMSVYSVFWRKEFIDSSVVALPVMFHYAHPKRSAQLEKGK